MMLPDHDRNDSDEGEQLDLTSDSYTPTDARTTNKNASQPGSLKDVYVHFRCCNVYWRFPIPQDILTGVKERWNVYCPRCGSKVELP